MKRIKNFGGFIKNLYEGTSISLTGTYLEPSNQRASGAFSKSSYSEVRKRFGKVFKEAPTTEGKNWGLKFVESGSGYNNSVNYKVVFPADFVSNFVTFMTKMGRKLDDVAKKHGLSSSVELLKKIKSGKLGDKIPKTVGGVTIDDLEDANRRRDKKPVEKTGSALELMQTVPPEYWKFIDFGVEGLGLRRKNIDWSLLENVRIQREREDYQFNRIHMPGIPDQFKGTGLGYIVYEEFIKSFGYARSEQGNASGDAQKVWSQLARDPDFMTIISQCSDRSAEVFLIHKDCKVPDMSDIIKKYINYLKKNNNLISIKYEDSIIDKYTDLDKKDFKIVIAKDPNLFSKFFTKLQDIMNGQSTTPESFTEIEDFSKSLIDDIEFHETRIKNLNDDFNNFQITPETKFRIFPNYITSDRLAVDRFFESNTDKVDSILSIGLLSLMKKTDLEKLRDKLSESLFEFLKIGKILLLQRANQEVQEKFIKEIVETLKEDLKLFNNPKFKFLYLIFLPIQNIFEIVSKHKRSGEDVSSMEKVVNSYIYHNIFDMGDNDKFVEDYLDEFKPDLSKFEPITNSQTVESYLEICSQRSVQKEMYKYYNLFPDKIKAKFIIMIFERSYDEKFKEILSKINLSNLSKSQEFKESFFKFYLSEEILRVIFSENIVTVTEFLELKKFVLENKHKRVIICHSLEKIMTTKNESKLNDLIDFLRKNDLIIQLRYMGDDSLDKQERESLTKWFFDVDINIIDKLVKNSIISTEFIFEIHRSYSKESDEVVEYLLQNDKNINIDKLIVLAESPEMKKKIRRLDKVTDNPSRREDYFFDMFPEEDSSDGVVEWLNKNQRDGQDGEFIILCLMAVLVSTNKKMTLSKLSKLSLNSLVTIFETVYKGENFVPFSDDNHKKQILTNDDRVNKFDKFFQKKNIVDFYSAFLPYIKDADFKKAIEQFLNQPTNEKKILNYKSFIKK